MYDAAIISLESVSSKWTAEAMRKYFSRVDELNLKEIDIQLSGNSSEVLYMGKPLKKYDCIYLKGSFRYAPLMRSLTSLLNNRSYMPIKADAFTTVHDKLLTHLAMQAHNIPMPKTYLNASIKSAKHVLEEMNYPIIMKFPQGTGGKGVLFSDSYSSASSMLDALSALKQSFLIQEFLDTGGKDIRVIVAGEEVIAAYQRKADIKEVRSNFHSGGSGKKVEIDDEIKKLAVKTAKAIDAEICGVDILKSREKKYCVIEANLSPGLQLATKTSGVDIADKIAKFLYQKTEERRSKEKKDGAEKIVSTINDEQAQEIISNLDFRSSRILLPEIVTKIAKFKDDQEYILKIKKDKLIIKKMEEN